MEQQTAQTIPLETLVPQVSTVSMQTFCEDMDGMLGISIGCALCQAVPGTVDKLKVFFPKFAAVYSVRAEGSLSGRFDLLLDKNALFLLSGTIVMLPADKIKEQCKQGTLEQALKLSDTVKEIGNLIVGAWDRMFREQLPGHKHLLQTNTQILNPWDKPSEVFGFKEDTTCLLIVWEMTVGDYPPFHGAAVFPAALFEPPKEEPAPEEALAQTPSESASTPETAPAQPEPAASQPPQTSEPAAAASATPENLQTSESHPVWNAIQQLVQFNPNGDVPSAPLDAAVLNCPARIFMNPKPLWLSPNDSVETALQRMQQSNARYALVEEKDQLAGILSRGDVNAALSPYLRSPFEEYRRPLDEASLQIRIRWFMSRPVHTASPDTPLWKIMETMCRHQIRAVPIQDAGGTVAGLVTVTEIFQTLLKTLSGGSSACQPEIKKECTKNE
ncbi:MAG TPA: CBS domain-containing protein [Anaerohalosphaeraceae bacterium]|nr:CBS domain-containing protein [Anaerohalosphaeraceae bacterium]